MKTYIPNLPALPSEILEGCELVKGSWVQMQDPEYAGHYPDPTTPGSIDGICALGAILRAFGVYASINALRSAVNDLTECGEFMVTLAQKVNPERPSPRNPRYYYDYAGDVKLSIVNWSDSGLTSKQDAIAALQSVERELGYDI